MSLEVVEEETRLILEENQSDFLLELVVPRIEVDVLSSWEILLPLH